MAEVLLARLDGPGGFLRTVVIKRILPMYASDRAFVEMFLDEAGIAASIRHPNVVHVEDLGLEGGEPYIVMEYLAGQSASALLERARSRKRPIDRRLAAHVAAEVLGGLHAAHQLVGPDGRPRGIVHRDVSPQNVMLTYDGHVKLLDFGIAHAEGRLARTSTGEVKGKIAYMSPEQCRGDVLDARSDIFSAGVMLYELVSSTHPFRRPDEAATLMALFSGSYAPLPRSGLPTDDLCEAIVSRSMSRDKEQRYASAAEMRRDLVKLIRAEDSSDEPLESLLAATLVDLFGAEVADPTRAAREVAPRPSGRAAQANVHDEPTSDAVSDPANEPPRAERRVGRYLIHERIGAGGMAEVFYGTLAGPAGISRPVAIKKLHPELVSDPDARAILLDEARLVARVQHPNVAALLDVVEEGEDLFLVLEYIGGTTVAALCRQGAVPADIANGIVIGALEGLHAAHTASGADGSILGIVHRDVSPQNIVLGADGLARVLDFGIAKAQGRAQQATRTGLIKGKLAYMAPEQLRTGIATVRSDVFSAGLVLFELLTGRRLFDGASEAAIRAQVLTGPRWTGADLVGPSAAVLPVLMKALATDPAERFPSAHAFAAALEEALAPASPRRIGAWLRADREPPVSTTERGPSPAEVVESAEHRLGLTIETPGSSRLSSDATRARRRRGALLVAAGLLVAGLGGVAVLLATSSPVEPVLAGTADATPTASEAALVPSVVPVASPTASPSSSASSLATASAPAPVKGPPPRGPARAPAGKPTAPVCKLVPQTDARGIVTFERVCK